MREIGVNPHEIHPCCMPRPVVKTSTRVRSMSEPSTSTTPHESALTSNTATDRGRSVGERNVRRLSLPILPAKRPLSPPAITAPRRPSPPSRIATAISRSAEEPRCSPTSPLKASPLTSLYTENHGASYLCTSVSANQALRNSVRVTRVHELARGSAAGAHAGGDERCWEPLPACPALVPAARPRPAAAPPAGPAAPAPPLSRVPSFASLETVSSSEGPATPHGGSPLPSPLHSPAPAASPTLAELEHQSRLRVPGQCVACKRTGHNFPHCPACGDRWCSRECRVQAAAGSRHVCPSRKGPQPGAAVPVAVAADS